MKKDKIEKTFLEELAKTSNMSVACEKLNLSRQSIYRWMDLDTKFREKVNEATQFGVDSISDLAESKLIGHIKSGSQRAIEYWLGNHKKEYFRPRPPNFWQMVADGNNKVERIEVKVFEKIKDVEEDRKDRENGVETNKNWVENNPTT